MSILYFLIADKQLEKNIGCYINDNQITDEAIEEIKNKASELLSTKTQIDKSKRYKCELQHTFLMYYLALPSTLYISGVNKGSYFTQHDHLVFELIEDVDSQGIRKLIDKEGKLIKVALQNLRYSIDKYQALLQEQENAKNKEIINKDSIDVLAQTKLQIQSETKPIEEKLNILDDTTKNNMTEMIDISLDDTPTSSSYSSSSSNETPRMIKDDIIIPKKAIKGNKKIYIAIGAICLLVLLSIIIVYNK